MTFFIHRRVWNIKNKKNERFRKWYFTIEMQFDSWLIWHIIRELHSHRSQDNSLQQGCCCFVFVFLLLYIRMRTPQREEHAGPNPRAWLYVHVRMALLLFFKKKTKQNKTTTNAGNLPWRNTLLWRLIGLPYSNFKSFSAESPLL